MRVSPWAACMPALLLLFLAAPAAAQNGTVQGRVTDSDTGSPLVSAVVDLVAANGATAASAITNADGRYRASVPPGTYTLTVSAIGFGTQRPRTVDVTAGATVTADAALAPRAVELEPVVVSVGRTQEKATDAPAHVEVIGEEAIEARPVTTPVDHLRNLSFVDVIQQGMQSTNVVVRGFNNIFSGALHVLTDNRIAGVPSLRVNVLNFVPQTNDDLQRMEVVLGPGAALYGPNTTDGVLHMITKSPLTSQETSFSVGGGTREMFTFSGRTSQLLTNTFGFKLSAQYFQAREWLYTDPVEQAEREKIDENPDFWAQDLANAAGISIGEAEARLARVGQRDFDIDRWSVDGRVDWQAGTDATVFLNGGISNAGSQIELTGLGAAQALDWRSLYGQVRLNWRRLFVQGYVNASDAGETFLLRNGTPITDQSKLWVGQAQHGFMLGARQTFTYGIDYLYTSPDTDGTINGAYEDQDDTKEFGAYLQSETQISPKLELVLAGRFDDHSALPDPIFSPRAAVVFKPTESQALRFTFNRAFSTPSSLNQFLDLGTPIPSAGAARLGYSVRVQGTGTEGFTFRQGDGSYVMRSPFTPTPLGGPTQLVPAGGAALYWQAAVQVLAQQQAMAGQPIDPALLQFLLSLQPTPGDIPSNWFDGQGNTGTVGSLEIADIEPIRESTSTTFEVGYRGALSERFLLAADAWYSKREDFVTPLITVTPFVALNGQATAGYLAPRLEAIGMPPAMAAQVAQQLAGGLAQVPLGVISSPEMQSATGAQLLATYTNVDESIDLFGFDIAATYLLTDAWILNGTASWVNDNAFDTATEPLYLNAPSEKVSLALAYRPTTGFNFEARTRYTGEFPGASGVYQALLGCEIDTTTDIEIEPCVEDYFLMDLMFGYTLPSMPGVSVDLSMTNVFDAGYRSFAGVPDIGRFTQIRLRYAF